MQRGFSDVGYLFVPHVCDFQPPKATGVARQHTVWRIQEFCLSGNAQEVLAWCREAYPGLLKTIPRSQHGGVVAGMIEGAWRNAACPC